MKSIFLKIKSALLKFFSKNQPSLKQQKKMITPENANSTEPKLLTKSESKAIKKHLLDIDKTQRQMANEMKVTFQHLCLVINCHRNASKKFCQHFKSVLNTKKQ